MKRIVNGVTYNDATSTLLAQQSWSSDDDSETSVDRLYQTQGGAFFIHEETTKMVWNEHERENEERVTHRFIPKSPEQTHRFLMEANDVEVFRNPFDDPPEAKAEAEPGATIYARVPAALKRSTDEAAKTAGVSVNTWVIRCLERCAANDGAVS